MKVSSQNLYTKIRDRLDGKFTDYGDYIACQCVYHDDSKPSMMIHDDGFKCLACGAGGSLSKLYKKLSGVDIVSAVKSAQYVRNPFTDWLEFYSLTEIAQKAHSGIKTAPGYLQRRGLLQSTLDHFKIGYLENWFTFPMWGKDRKVVGMIARGGPNVLNSRYMMPKDQHGLFYTTYNIKDVVYVTFGILDAISIWQVGLPAISTTSGKNVDPELFDNLRCRIRIIPDDEEESNALKLASKLGWRGEVLRFPYHLFGSAKDPNDCLRNNSELFKQTLVTL